MVLLRAVLGILSAVVFPARYLKVWLQNTSDPRYWLPMLVGLLLGLFTTLFVWVIPSKPNFSIAYLVTAIAYAVGLLLVRDADNGLREPHNIPFATT